MNAMQMIIRFSRMLKNCLNGPNSQSSADLPQSIDTELYTKTISVSKVN